MVNDAVWKFPDTNIEFTKAIIVNRYLYKAESFHITLTKFEYGMEGDIHWTSNDQDQKRTLKLAAFAYGTVAGHNVELLLKA